MTRHGSIGSGLLLLVAVSGGMAFGLVGCTEGGTVAILDLTPKVGSTQGEQYVEIVGQNFRQDIGYTVYFGTKKSAQVTMVDPETLLASTPTGLKAGTVDVTIRADDGNAFRLPQAFKFEGVEGDGAAIEAKKAAKGNLAY